MNPVAAKCIVCYSSYYQTTEEHKCCSDDCAWHHAEAITRKSECIKSTGLKLSLIKGRIKNGSSNARKISG